MKLRNKLAAALLSLTVITGTAALAPVGASATTDDPAEVVISVTKEQLEENASGAIQTALYEAAENGMDNDSELTVYQKGTPVSDLPENVRRKYQFKLNRLDDAPIAYNLLYDSQNDLLFWENYGIDRYENSSL